MNPTCDIIERMRPCARLMIYITLFDDFFGMTPAKELKIMADRVYEMMEEIPFKQGEIELIQRSLII